MSTFALAALSVKAQLVPDRTLGTENSTITPQGVRDLIEGGARRGSNLFHSFFEFNVDNQQQVYFANPAGVANILTRVTGNNASNILGTLGVEGTANLFLMNPNGIIFGGNAQLDISGSFVASTADGIKLGESGIFSAKEPQNSTLLAIQPGVLFSVALRSHQAEIRNQGSLTVGTGQNLTLHADTVTSTGNLTAPGGTVQVLGDRVSLLNNASIDVSAPTGGGTVLIGNGKQVNIASSVRINADAIPPNSSLASVGNGNGGTVIVKSDEATHFEGYISARGGENSGNGGFVEVSGGNLQFSGSVDTSAPFGQVGTLLIDPKNILIQAGSPISGLAISQALFLNDVILQADNDITVDDDITGIGANSLTLLAGRSLTIAPNRRILLNGGNFTAKFNDENALIPSDRDPGIAQFVMSPASQILTNGGNVVIASGTFGQTSQINTANAGIITSNQAGNSGNITLFALGDVTTGLLDTRSGTGNGGNVSVTSAGGANCLGGSACAIATTNSVLTDSVLQAGDILLNATGNLSITADEFNVNGNITSNGAVPGKITLTSGGILSGRGVVLANSIFGSGTSNSLTNGITLTANSIVLEDAFVTTNTFGNGRGGDLSVNATEDVILRNSAIATIANSLSDSFRPTGDAGNLTVNTRRLTIIHAPGSTFPYPVGLGTFANTPTDGNAGNLTVNAEESVEIVGDKPGSFTILPNQQSQASLLLETGLSTTAFGGGNSGNLTVNTGRLVVRDGAGITTFPTQGKGGDLTVNATEVFLQGQGGISTITTPLAKDAGNLELNAERVTLTDGAAIATTTYGSGKAGDLTLSVRQLSIRNGSAISATTLGQGDGGTLTIKNSDFIEAVGTSPDGSFSSGIYADSLSTGKGGAIEINTRSLLLDNGIINASTVGSGNGGNITIRASEFVEVIGSGFNALQQQIIAPAVEGTLKPNNFNQGIVTTTAGQGTAGNVVIETPNFIARDGGLIATTTLAPPTLSAPGKGGDITINASDTLTLDNALLSTGTFNAADAGNISLSARQLTARGGAQALTTTFGSGKAGDLTVNVSDSIELIDPNNSGRLLSTGLFASSAQTASGKGGDININIPNGELNIRNGATVSVSAEGTGNAGDINVDARSIFLDKGSITATSTSGEGGNINLRVANNLILRNNSQISTRAGIQPSDRGNGGNMNINAQFVVAVPKENSDIIANAFAGRGGNINITAQGIFGLQVSEQLTPNSDITASSQLGIDGTVELNTPDIDPSRGLTALPSNLSNPSNQIVAGCPADRGNKFAITGRGGIPEHPSQYLQEGAVWLDTRDLSGANRLTQPVANDPHPTHHNQPLIEAQGWIVDAHGTVILTAEPHTGKQSNPWVSSQSCEDISNKPLTGK
ncbi:MAG TPA: filamentous hemagglutinin N-terminal domain-containing protein [Stenomitos sp.]